MVARLREKGIRDEAVLAAIGATPRIFRRGALASRAYGTPPCRRLRADHLATLRGWRAMLEALRRDKPLSKVLEIGTGCGYQAALLARLARKSIRSSALRIARKGARKPALLAPVEPEAGARPTAPEDARSSALRRHHRRGGGARDSGALLQQLCAGWQNDRARGSGDQALCLVERTPTGLTEKWLDAVRLYFERRQAVNGRDFFRPYSLLRSWPDARARIAHRSSSGPSAARPPRNRPRRAEQRPEATPSSAAIPLQHRARQWPRLSGFAAWNNIYRPGRHQGRDGAAHAAPGRSGGASPGRDAGPADGGSAGAGPRRGRALWKLARSARIRGQAPRRGAGTTACRGRSSQDRPQA